MGWSQFRWSQTTIAAADTKALVAGLVITSTLDLTLLRIRGMLAVAPDQNSTTEDQVGALGVIVVTTDAFAAGAASVPGPISDVGSDWMLWMPFVQRFNVVTAIGTHVDFNTQYVIDNKAQRIMEPGETLAIVVESGSESEGFITSAQGRILSRVRGTR